MVKKQVVEWKQFVGKPILAEFVEGFEVEGKLSSLNERELKIKDASTNKILSFSTDKLKKIVELEK